MLLLFKNLVQIKPNLILPNAVTSNYLLILWIESERLAVDKLLHLLLRESVLLKVEVERYGALRLVADVV